MLVIVRFSYKLYENTQNDSASSSQLKSYKVHITFLYSLIQLGERNLITLTPCGPLTLKRVLMHETAVAVVPVTVCKHYTFGVRISGLCVGLFM